jgi:hypothetical protein
MAERMFRALFLAVGIVLLAGTAIATLFMGVTFAPCFLPTLSSFDPVVWHIAESEEVCSRRFDMQDDLLANHLAAGMSRQEVLHLLGPPTADPTLVLDDGGTELLYRTGCWIDCYWVVGRVRR